MTKRRQKNNYVCREKMWASSNEDIRLTASCTSGSPSHHLAAFRE